MTEIYLKDSIEFDAIKKNVNLCRTGEYQYLAKELGLNDRKPDDIVKVFRDEQSVKDIVDKINEYQAIPILINHPDKFVDLNDSMNYKRGGVGKSKLKKIGDSQVASAKIIAIGDDTKELVDKKCEVSMGYTAELMLSTNSLYDYTLNIKDVNHLALLSGNGRAGSLCSIQDKGIDFKKLITDKLSEEEMTDNQKTKDTIKNTEAAAEVDPVETPQAPAEAEAPKTEPIVETKDEETKSVETKDSLPIIDTAKIFNDGLAKATKDYINVIKFIDAGLITSKDAINGNPQDLIDKALEKVYNKKIEDVAVKDSYIDLAVANLNKKHWNFNDTKSVAKANDGVFINNLFNK